MLEFVDVTGEEIPEPPEWYEEPKTDWDYVKDIPEDEKVGEWSLWSAGEYDCDCMYNEKTDKYVARWLRIRCECGREWSPFLSPYTRRLWSGWTWRCLDYSEPETKYTTTCRICKKHYGFSVFVPQ